MDIKKMLQKHVLTILCAAAVLVLLLPFISVSAEISSSFVSAESSVTTTGFSAMGSTIFGYGLLAGPVLLVAMNYVKKLEKYKGLLAILVPIVCLIIEVITFFQAKGASASASGGFVNVEVSASLGIGFILLIVIYIAMIVAGAVLYHNFTLDKQGLERLKSEGAGFLGNGMDKIKEGTAKIGGSLGEKFSNEEKSESSATSKKSINHQKTQEILELIEKLASMKEKGILTEEEFAAKKQELLEGI